MRQDAVLWGPRLSGHGKISRGEIDMATNLSRLLNNSLNDAAARRSTKTKSAKTARSEIIAAIIKADGGNSSATYMVLRGEAQCPMRKCLQAFAQVLPVTMGQITEQTKKDGCVYNSDGYGYVPKNNKSRSKAAVGGLLVIDGAKISLTR